MIKSKISIDFLLKTIVELQKLKIILFNDLQLSLFNNLSNLDFRIDQLDLCQFNYEKILNAMDDPQIEHLKLNFQSLLK
jgi:hypothetical protein